MDVRLRDPVSAAEAIRLQESLRPKVILKKTWDRLSVLGAVDCSHTVGSTMGRAAIVLPLLASISALIWLADRRGVKTVMPG